MQKSDRSSDSIKSFTEFRARWVKKKTPKTERNYFSLKDKNYRPKPHQSNQTVIILAFHNETGEKICF